MANDNARSAYNAARKAADAEYVRDLEVADAEHERAIAEADSESSAAYAVISAAARRKHHSDAACAQANASNKAEADEWRAKTLEIENQHSAQRKAARTKYESAYDAASEAFDRIKRRRKAAKRTAAESQRQRNEVEAGRQRKVAARQRVADQFELPRQIEKATTPQIITISPAQAAARLGMTLAVFWTHVRSGRYPAPDDDNRYDAATIDRLPRPKVRVRRAVPDNVLTRIMKF